MNDKGFLQELTKETVLEMTREFNFKTFFETKPHIALVAITQYDVIIVHANTANENFKEHSKLLAKLQNLMLELDRYKYSMMTYRCSSTDTTRLAAFSMVDIAGTKRVNTKEMIEALKLIHKLLSLIGKDKPIQKGKIEDLIKLNSISETNSDDFIADAEVIGIPIKDFNDKLKDDISKIESSNETEIPVGSDTER